MYEFGLATQSQGTLQILAFHVTSARRGLKPFARALEISHDLVLVANAVQNEILTLSDCGIGFRLLAQARADDTELMAQRRVLYGELSEICGASDKGQPLALAIVLSEAYEKLKKSPDPRIKSIAEFAREASEQLETLIN